VLRARSTYPRDVATAAASERNTRQHPPTTPGALPGPDKATETSGRIRDDPASPAVGATTGCIDRQGRRQPPRAQKEELIR